MGLRGATDFLREMRANRIADPFQSEMRVRAHEGQWRIFEIRSLTAHIDWIMGGQSAAQDFLKR